MTKIEYKITEILLSSEYDFNEARRVQALAELVEAERRGAAEDAAAKLCRVVKDRVGRAVADAVWEVYQAAKSAPDHNPG